MCQLSAEVRIERDSFPDALAAIKALQGRETCGTAGDMHFIWIDPPSYRDAASLEEVLHVWRWPVANTDSDGNILELEFSGQNYGDANLLFEAIAPLVSSGSEIRMAGEDGALWRWHFVDGGVTKEFGRLVFDSLALEQLPDDVVTNSWPHSR